VYIGIHLIQKVLKSLFLHTVIRRKRRLILIVHNSVWDSIADKGIDAMKRLSKAVSPYLKKI
jgi:hypothetical protein